MIRPALSTVVVAGCTLVMPKRYVAGGVPSLRTVRTAVVRPASTYRLKGAGTAATAPWPLGLIGAS